MAWNSARFDERGSRQTDPALDLMEMQIVEPVREGNLLPCGGDQAHGRPEASAHPCCAPRQQAIHESSLGARVCCGTAEPAGMAEPGPDHELGAAIGTGFRESRGRSRGSCDRRWF